MGTPKNLYLRTLKLMFSNSVLRVYIPSLYPFIRSRVFTCISSAIIRVCFYTSIRFKQLSIDDTTFVSIHYPTAFYGKF